MTGTPSQPHRRRRGFTIAEVLVVLVIISFASTVSLLAYSNYRKAATVRSAAEMIKRTMVDARYRAIANGTPSQVVFDLTNQAFWVDVLDTDGSILKPKVIQPEPIGEEVVLESVQIQSTTYSSGQRSVIFQADGTNPLAKVILRREADDPNLDESYYTVQIYPSSAEPHIWANTRR